MIFSYVYVYMHYIRVCCDLYSRWSYGYYFSHPDALIFSNCSKAYYDMFKDLSKEYKGYYEIDCFLSELKPIMTLISTRTSSLVIDLIYSRADSMRTPSQWETSLQSNAVSHWLPANLSSTLYSNDKRPPTVACVVSYKCNINIIKCNIYIHM